ncbi:MAG: inner membrane CreD family protein [Verrucomicrobiaceae bacterium]|nr:inner membrane CreD family protein [Verrucomicrobiaceae bacterium]
MIKRLILIGIIAALATLAWWILGSIILARTHSAYGNTRNAVRELWGPSLEQKHPWAIYRDASGDVVLLPSETIAKVRIDYEPRRRGLMWHRTYVVAFSADYTFQNPTNLALPVQLFIQLPATRTGVFDFEFTTGAESLTPQPLDGTGSTTLSTRLEIAPGATVPLHVAFKCRGTDRWRYSFTPDSHVQNFTLNLESNHRDIDFPLDATSPTEPVIENADGGLTMGWRYSDVIGAPAIALEMPEPIASAWLAAKVSFFAPLSLFIFFGVLWIVGEVKKTLLHPMNYFFLAAAFFAFPLLFAYLLEVINAHLAFVIAATTSLVLVGGYLRMVAGGALFRIALPVQFVYMALFSYSFFLRGYTGLTITIGCVLTLGALMFSTAGVNWAQLWQELRPTPPLPAPVGVPCESAPE